MDISQGPATRAERATVSLGKHQQRRRLAEQLAADHGGVVTRAMLAAAGLTRGQVRVEVERGAWRPAGRHTLCLTGEPVGTGLWWRALFESGERSVLDGTTSLLAAGLSGWKEDLVHVSVPDDAKVRPLPGVRHHRPREIGETYLVGLRRTRPAVAVIRAAQWAPSSRQAATLIAMTVQQRLAPAASVLERWAAVRRSPRRELLAGVIADVCAGAHSLTELDFARLCRRRGLPEPSRQVVRAARQGRVYLDVFWDTWGVHVEIQGAQHFQGTAGIDDALRFNDLGLRDSRLISLQIPVLGLRVCPDQFLAQVEQALERAGARGAA